MPLRLALYEPDIPPNTGTLIRLAACLGVAVDIIEPCGFQFSDRALKRAGMDYAERAVVAHHASWSRFEETRRSGRLILLTTRGTCAHTQFAFAADDTLLLGREGAGVPQAVHDTADARLFIPMRPGFRSLNVAVAGAMALGEALRQTGGFLTTPA